MLAFRQVMVSQRGLKISRPKRARMGIYNLLPERQHLWLVKLYQKKRGPNLNRNKRVVKGKLKQKILRLRLHLLNPSWIINPLKNELKSIRICICLPNLSSANLSNILTSNRTLQMNLLPQKRGATNFSKMLNLSRLKDNKLLTTLMTLPSTITSVQLTKVWKTRSHRHRTRSE